MCAHNSSSLLSTKPAPKPCSPSALTLPSHSSTRMLWFSRINLITKNVSFGSYHMLAAEQDNAEGCFFVANAYQFGHGTSVDLKVTVDP